MCVCLCFVCVCVWRERERVEVRNEKISNLSLSIVEKEEEEEDDFVACSFLVNTISLKPCFHYKTFRVCDRHVIKTEKFLFKRKENNRERALLHFTHTSQLRMKAFFFGWKKKTKVLAEWLT